MYIFTETSSGDRTNIMASFPLWDKEMFLNQAKNTNNYHGRFRYGVVGGYVTLLKDMLLEEFETLFSAEDFTSKQITELFRKEISEKYGEHAEKAKIKPLSKKQLERGCIYEDFTGSYWVYYGEVELTIDKTYLKRYDSEKKPLEVSKGLGFGMVWESGFKSYKPSTKINVLKSPKKLIRKVDSPRIEFNDTYKFETGRMNFGSQEKKEILILL